MEVVVASPAVSLITRISRRRSSLHLCLGERPGKFLVYMSKKVEGAYIGVLGQSVPEVPVNPVTSLGGVVPEPIQRRPRVAPEVIKLADGGARRDLSLQIPEAASFGGHAERGRGVACLGLQVDGAP